MIEALLARWVTANAARLIAKLLPYLLVALAIGGVALWVRQVHRHAKKQDAVIVRQIGQIDQLQRDIANEEAARRRDVAGLTVLTQGLANAAIARGADRKALEETIDAHHPQPASHSLAALLGRLRSADAAAASGKPAAGGTGRSSARRPAGAR